MSQITAVLPQSARALIEPHLGEGIDAHWFASAEEAFALAPRAEIGWLDLPLPGLVGRAIGLGARLKWVFTVYAGLDAFPLEALRDRGTVLTNGAGLNAIPVAEYAVMGVLAAAKRIDHVVRAQDRREWLAVAPGTAELFESKALIIGYGAIGALIGERLKAFGVSVTGVRRSRSDDPAIIGPDDWRARLGEYDWIILAAPSTSETRAMLGDAEFAAMKSSAWLINIARGDMIDQEALLSALARKQLGGAFLDTVSPEPLPPESPLWAAPDVMVTMHLSGRSQTRLFERAAVRFLENLALYRAGQPLLHEVDLVRGY